MRDRGFRIPESRDGAIQWPERRTGNGPPEPVLAVYSRAASCWRVVGVERAFGDPLELVTRYGNDWGHREHRHGTGGIVTAPHTLPAAADPPSNRRPVCLVAPAAAGTPSRKEAAVAASEEQHRLAREWAAKQPEPAQGSRAAWARFDRAEELDELDREQRGGNR